MVQILDYERQQSENVKMLRYIYMKVEQRQTWIMGASARHAKNALNSSEEYFLWTYPRMLLCILEHMKEHSIRETVRTLILDEYIAKSLFGNLQTYAQDLTEVQILFINGKVAYWQKESPVLLNFSFGCVLKIWCNIKRSTPYFLITLDFKQPYKLF